MFRAVVTAVLSAFVLLLPVGAGHADDGQAGTVVVTGVVLKRTGNGGAAAKRFAEVTINNVLVIKEITVSSVGGRTLIKFPEYVSRYNRVYPQVRCLTREANDAVRAAIDAGTAAAVAAPAPVRYAVTRFSRFRKNSRLKAFATVSFNNAIEVECKVMHGRNGPWIAWPARPDARGGRWMKQVVIADKRLKETIEADLLERYAAISGENAAEE